MSEWDKLAKWVVNYKVVSHNVRWLIQIPRLYEVYHQNGQVTSFEDIIKSGCSWLDWALLGCWMLNNYSDIFGPLFEVTKDPSSHPELHVFLQRVIGFDCVDDESKAERRIHRKVSHCKL